ncbi:MULTISPECIES: PspC domain-containing protein [Brevibacillus]|uniref:PspC domain-containing protein n=1 Tax=Brevibacillus brevis TaxID=1393 RepID=A0A2Z4MR35_BREBE|nr:MULTISPECIES: PspC domain-containing protein [Brevibacillus]AWX59014.1 PspC domain-containing protein [Brevibacillus brevis]NRR24580.1 PspC domain-containing protein [Brevibacillus sp. MS2.2]
MKRQLKRSSTDKSILGVCGGIADFFGISSLIVRLIFTVLIPVLGVVYIVLGNVLEEDRRL